MNGVPILHRTGRHEGRPVAASLLVVSLFATGVLFRVTKPAPIAPLSARGVMPVLALPAGVLAVAPGLGAGIEPVHIEPPATSATLLAARHPVAGVEWPVVQTVENQAPPVAPIDARWFALPAGYAGAIQPGAVRVPETRGRGAVTRALLTTGTAITGAFKKTF